MMASGSSKGVCCQAEGLKLTEFQRVSNLRKNVMVQPVSSSCACDLFRVDGVHGKMLLYIRTKERTKQNFREQKT